MELELKLDCLSGEHAVLTLMIWRSALQGLSGTLGRGAREPIRGSLNSFFQVQCLPWRYWRLRWFLKDSWELAINKTGSLGKNIIRQDLIKEFVIYPGGQWRVVRRRMLRSAWSFRNITLAAMLPMWQDSEEDGVVGENKGHGVWQTQWSALGDRWLSPSESWFSHFKNEE